MTIPSIGSGKLIHNVAPKGLRVGFIRLGNSVQQPDETDCYIGMVDGVPAGAYGLPTGAAALLLRSDPAGSGSVVYVSHDGGTTWTALTNATFDPQDTEALTFGNADDIAMAWDGTRFNVTQAAPNSEIRWGVSGAGIDQKWYGDTVAADLTWDQSADSLIFGDNAKAVFGTGSDIAVSWNATKLVVTQAAPNSAIDLGVSGAGIDLQLYGDTVGRDLLWDQSADSLIFGDDAKLVLGTGSDITASWNGTKLLIGQAAANSAIDFGVDGAGIDLVLYGDTASAAATWDQSADSLILSGVAKIKLQTIAAATGAAIPVTHSGSLPITTAAAETNTLADPSYLGQTISIFADTYAVGDRVITAASRINQAGNTIITLGAVGDYIKLEAITIGGALKWQVVANDGAALSGP